MFFDFRASVPNRLTPPIKTRYVPNNWSSAQISRYSAESSELAGTSHSRQATNTSQPHRNQRRKNNTTKKKTLFASISEQKMVITNPFLSQQTWDLLALVRPGVFFRIPPGQRERIYIGH